MSEPIHSDVAGPVRELIEHYRELPGALLPLLHAVQERFGHVPQPAVAAIAEGLNLSRAEVHGVVTYYHFFRHERPGRHIVQVCRAESCKACGADELLAQAETLLHCKAHETRADGAVSLEPVYCLGLCALSPAVMIDERPIARVTPQRLAQLVNDLDVPA